MPDSPRLSELRRQRALVQEHLAWLDGLIAAQEAVAPPERGASSASALSTPATAGEASRAAPPLSDNDTESLLAEYRTPAVDVVRSVRTGCLLYFAAALALVAGVVAVLYFALRR